MRYLVLFSPALVLLSMTVAVAIKDGWISGPILIAFLAVLTVSVAGAEVVRFQLRREAREQEHE